MGTLALPPPPATALERFVRRPWGAFRTWASDPERRVLLRVGTAIAALGICTILVGAGLHIAGEPVRWTGDGIDPDTGSPVPVVNELGLVLMFAGSLPFVMLAVGVLFLAMIAVYASVACGLLLGLILGAERIWRWVQPPPEPPPRETASSRAGAGPAAGAARRPRPRWWDPDGHYAVLGIDPRTPPLLARHAYRKMALRHHPDRGGDLVRMRRVNLAWEVIGDPQRRGAYDRAAESGAHQGAGGR